MVTIGIDDLEDVNHCLKAGLGAVHLVHNGLNARVVVGLKVARVFIIETKEDELEKSTSE